MIILKIILWLLSFLLAGACGVMVLVSLFTPKTIKWAHPSKRTKSNAISFWIIPGFWGLFAVFFLFDPDRSPGLISWIIAGILFAVVLWKAFFLFIPKAKTASDDKTAQV